MTQTPAVDPFQFAFNPAFNEQFSQVKSAVQNPFFQQIGLNLGSKVFDLSKKYDSIFNTIFSSDYRYYFDVDNRYVTKKLAVLMAPYMARGDWAQSGESDDPSQVQHMGYSSPKSNLHAPDLYIPMMSLVTFILLCCFSMGYGSHFDPKHIGDTFWKCVVVSILEVLVFKIVFCFLDGNRVGTLNLISHLNYRYVSLCYVIIVNMTIGGIITMGVTWYLLFCQGFFVYKTLQRYSAQNRVSALELSHFGQKIIALLAIIQPFFSWVLLKIIGEY